VKCVQCSYSLEGLPGDGVCPECGLPICDSHAPPPRPSITEFRAGRIFLGVFVGGAIELVLSWFCSSVFHGPVLYFPRSLPVDRTLCVASSGCFMLVFWGTLIWGARFLPNQLPSGTGRLASVSLVLVLFMCLGFMSELGVTE
jgi:hypothetical protein